MRNTRRSIAAIAQAGGFQTRSYYYTQRLCKRLDMTAREYRKAILHIKRNNKGPKAPGSGNLRADLRYMQ